MLILIGGLLLFSNPSKLTVKSILFTVSDGDKNSVTSVITFLHLLLSLNMFLVIDIIFSIFKDNLCLIVCKCQLYILWSQLSKHCYGQSPEQLSWDHYYTYFKLATNCCFEQTLNYSNFLLVIGVLLGSPFF